MGGACAAPIIGYVTSSTVRILPAIADQRPYDRVSFRGCFAVRFPRSLKLIIRTAAVEPSFATSIRVAAAKVSSLVSAVKMILLSTAILGGLLPLVPTASAINNGVGRLPGEFHARRGVFVTHSVHVTSPRIQQ